MKCGGDQLSCPPSSRRGKTANHLRGLQTSCPIRLHDSRFPPRPTPSPRPSTCLQHMPEKTWEMDAQAPPRAGPSCYPMSAPRLRPGLALAPARRFFSCQGNTRSSNMHPRNSKSVPEALYSRSPGEICIPCGPVMAAFVYAGISRASGIPCGACPVWVELWPIIVCCVGFC